MKYATAAAFRRALEQRIKDAADHNIGAIARTRKRVAFDRLLARLAAVAPSQWAVKGGFALDLRLADRARTTQDIDLAWSGHAAELIDTLIGASAHDVGDYFGFLIEKTSDPTDRLGGTHRFRVNASLAGRPFETFLLDVGTLDGALAPTDSVNTPNLLDFAGIVPVTVPLLPIAAHTAEKLHAFTRVYEGGRESTRPKDLVDLVLIAQSFELDARDLRLAIDHVFERQNTHPAPTALPAPPASWRLPFERLAASVGVEEGLSEAHATAGALLDPVLQSVVTKGVWNPDTQGWEA
jgi:hypothetical protein